jgi:hypothetical protein
MCSVLRLMWLSVLEFLRLWIDSLNVVLFFGLSSPPPLSYRRVRM